MVKKKREVDTKLCAIVLSLLLVVAVVLVVVNVVLMNKGGDDGEVLEKTIYGDVGKCLEIEKDSMAIDCINDMAFSFYSDEDCARALGVYDEVPEDRFDTEVLSNFYDEAYSMSLSCDEPLQNYWLKKSSELMNRMEARG